MFGDNPKRPVLVHDGNVLEVKNIFKTIQGEGPFVGEPAIFVRLGGCNLACSFCDTDFENYESIKTDQLVAKVIELSKNSIGQRSIKLVVITGGEPLRQPIEKLCQNLVDLECVVQIETNGTLFRKLPKVVNIVCSPKAQKNGYSKIREDLLPNISALKFLISKSIEKYHSVPELGQTEYNIPVFVQPMDQNNEKLNKENTEMAIKIAIEKGYRLSIQVHKIVGVD